MIRTINLFFIFPYNNSYDLKYISLRTSFLSEYWSCFNSFPSFNVCKTGSSGPSSDSGDLSELQQIHSTQQRERTDIVDINMMVTISARLKEGGVTSSLSGSIVQLTSNDNINETKNQNNIS